jgi:hypothetical protein
MEGGQGHGRSNVIAATVKQSVRTSLIVTLNLFQGQFSTREAARPWMLKQVQHDVSGIRQPEAPFWIASSLRSSQ